MGDGSNYRLSALVHVNVFDYHALLFGGFLGIGDDHYPMPWQSAEVRHEPWRIPDQSDCRQAQGRTVNDYYSGF
jgi:hypothetical protein